MNSVEIIGYLGEKLEEGVRLIDVGLPYFNKNGDSNVILKVRYWSEDQNNYFLNLEDKTQVAIRGHLDKSEKYGIILIVEEVNVIKKAK